MEKMGGESAPLISNVQQIPAVEHGYIGIRLKRIGELMQIIKREFHQYMKYQTEEKVKERMKIYIQWLTSLRCAKSYCEEARKIVNTVDVREITELCFGTTEWMSQDTFTSRIMEFAKRNESRFIVAGYNTQQFSASRLVDLVEKAKKGLDEQFDAYLKFAKGQFKILEELVYPLATLRTHENSQKEVAAFIQRNPMNFFNKRYYDRIYTKLRRDRTCGQPCIYRYPDVSPNPLDIFAGPGYFSVSSVMDVMKNARLVLGKIYKDGNYTLESLRKSVETKKGEFSDDIIRKLISHTYEMRKGNPLCKRLSSYTSTLDCITDMYPISLQESCNEDELAKYGPRERSTIYYQQNRLKNLWFYLEYFDLQGPDAERVRDLLVEKFPYKAGCIRIAGEGARAPLAPLG